MTTAEDGIDSTIAPLHVRSGYSLLRGTMHLEHLLRRAAAIGHTHLALTDVNNLYGATRFHKLACEAGLRPIIGAELLEGDLSLVALVADDTGYENLCRLITRIHRRAEQPEAGNPKSEALISDLAELSDGLEIVVEDASPAEALLERGVARRGVWMGIDPTTHSYPAIRRMVERASELDLPLVGTGTALMSDRGDLDVARLLVAIRTGATFDTVPADLLPHPRAALRSPAQLRRRFAGLPGEAACNNRRLVERCAGFSLLPRAPVFPAFPAPGGQTPRAYLRVLCEEGMVRRYGKPSAQVRSRLERELSLIERMGFCEYFLVVWDIVRYARRSGAPVAGRGSGASSLVAYLLGITNVCPLEYDIPFERFLHEQREDFPDLDVDFCWRIRDDVIDYVFRRWGDGVVSKSRFLQKTRFEASDHVAMVCTHNTFQPRSALRETAKAFGLSNDQISRLETVDLHSARDRTRVAIRGISEEISARIVRLSRAILDLPRNLSVHPGGIVISPRPIDRTVPIELAAKGVKITQYDKDGVEDIALVKLDLLGNRNLSTIRAACEEIEKRCGRRIDVERLPPADPQTVALLRSAHTVGCNQLESPAIRHLLKMLRPSSTRDVMKVLALIRPGAAGIGMKEAFVRRSRGLDRVPVGDPRVNGGLQLPFFAKNRDWWAHAVLAETHGVMLYEDDVMLVGAAMLGASLAEADMFRKAVQQCRTDQRRLELSRDFLARCVRNGVDPDYAKSMWVQMAKFNSYSFCRAHAASYALLAYAGAYLKAHYPLEFWVGALNNNQSMYHPRVYVEQARRGGVRFLLPDVNRSGEEFTIDGNAIRVGLNFVAGLGPCGVGEILSTRTAGAFESLSDFLTRTRLGEREVRSLILCGTFDAFGRPRPALMMEFNLFRRIGAARGSAGPALFQAAPVIPTPPGDYSYARKYFDERRILGVSVRKHIMELIRPLLDGVAPRRSASALDPPVEIDSRRLEAAQGKLVRIAGVIEARRTTRTERGEMMMFLTMDDEYGLFEVTLFPDVARQYSGGFSHYGPYVVTGKVENQYDSLSVTAASIEYADVSFRIAERHDLHASPWESS